MATQVDQVIPVEEQVPAGYKKTELGMIPEDWKIIPFGDLVDYKKGYPFKSSEYKDSGIRIIRVSDTNFSGIKNTEGVCIDIESAKKYKNWLLEEGDLIFSTVGSKPPMYDSLVGKAVCVSIEHKGALLNQNAVRIRARSRSIELQLLLLNHFRTPRYIDYIETIYRGNANQASITLENLFEYKISIPECENEQKAIANALSDTDALIIELEKLIAKKQAIKTATMQQLLTGRTRLPQFAYHPDGTPKGYQQTELGEIPEDWSISKLRELSDRITKGTTPMTLGRNFVSQGINFIRVESIDEHGGIDEKKFVYIDDETDRLLLRSRVNEGDLLISIAGALGRAAIVNKNIFPANINQALAIIRLIENSLIKVEYLFYFTKTNFFTDRIKEISSQGAQPNLSLSDLSDFSILFPNIEEQKEIFNILSSMDSEVQVLEERLAKTRSIKQGMMQQLLTGKIRLMKPQDLANERSTQ